MNYITATQTDIGTRKKTNQDSMIVMQAATDRGQVLLASVCDGMGGLAKGEVASAAMVHALEKWFTQQLPTLLAEGFEETKLWEQWKEMIEDTNSQIGSYGVKHHTALGTTCVALLIVDQDYYIVNVGDSRAYLLADTIYQLTKDQTEAQLLVDEGKIAEEQYYFHEARNKLLCPLGSFETPKLDRFSGKIRKDCIFLMTTDGIHYAIRPEPMTSLVLENPNFDDACVTLCEAAESLESNDDYGAILIQCV